MPREYKPWTAEQRARASAAQLERFSRPEERAKLSAAHTGKVHSGAWCARKSAALRARFADPAKAAQTLKKRTATWDKPGAREAAARKSTKHGAYRSSTYKSWSSMRSRCLNHKATSYALYGGRGIKICPDWQGEHGYERFVTDVGERPAGHTIERIDVNGNYEPGNVCWADVKEQAMNRRSARLIAIRGDVKTVQEWSDISGVRWSTLEHRASRGWADADLLLPAGTQRRHPRAERNDPQLSFARALAREHAARIQYSEMVTL